MMPRRIDLKACPLFYLFEAGFCLRRRNHVGKEGVPEREFVFFLYPLASDRGGGNKEDEREAEEERD